MYVKQQEAVDVGPDDVTLRALIKEAWSVRLAVACAAVVMGAIGAVTGALMPKQYRASVVVSPVLKDLSSNPVAGMGSLASAAAGLSSLAGISLNGASRREEAIAVLQSELLTAKYIRENNLLPVLYAKAWDSATQTWKAAEPHKRPSVWKATLYFRTKVAKVSEDKKTGVVILTIKWKDPKLAATWSNDLVRITNEYLRTKAIRESEQNIEYLNAEAAKTRVVEARRAIYSLLKDEINRQMLAQGEDEYALKVLDPATVPEEPSSPGVILLALAGSCLGAGLPIALVVARRIFTGPPLPSGEGEIKVEVDRNPDCPAVSAEASVSRT